MLPPAVKLAEVVGAVDERVDRCRRTPDRATPPGPCRCPDGNTLVTGVKSIRKVFIDDDAAVIGPGRNSWSLSWRKATMLPPRLTELSGTMNGVVLRLKSGSRRKPVKLR